MRKIVLLLILVSLYSATESKAQKNELSATPFIYINNGIYGGSMVGYGLDLSYSRSLGNLIDLNISLGKGSFSGKNTTQFDLENNEINYLSLTRSGIGLDYAFYKNPKLNLSAGAEVLLSSFPFVRSLHKGNLGEITFRHVDTTSTLNYLFHLKMENHIGNNTYWNTQISYQPYFISDIEVIMARTGISYRF